MFTSARLTGRVLLALAMTSVFPALALAQGAGAVRVLQVDGLARGGFPESRGTAGDKHAAVPFTVGEELAYRVTYGGIGAGKARMQVTGIDTIRGRPAYHLTFTIDGGIPGLRVHDRYESWVDVVSLSSLRHVQQISEGRYRRKTTYEIWPERLEYQKNDEPSLPSVANPLDDGSFVYAVRIAGISAGETRRDDRYFRPDRNPVVLTGVSVDTLTVGAGTFVTTMVRPSIKTDGMFAENTNSRIWFSADADRFPVQVKIRLAKLPLTLTLESVTRGAPR